MCKDFSERTLRLEDEEEVVIVPDILQWRRSPGIYIYIFGGIDYKGRIAMDGD